MRASHLAAIVLLAAGGLLAVVPTAGAQVPLGAPSIAVNVNAHDFGEPGSPRDDCLALDMDAAPSAAVDPFDLRLTPCSGQGAGTEVRDEDVAERSAAYPQANGAAAEAVRYADVDSNGRFSGDDIVYVTSASGAGTGLVRTTGTASWSVRVTAAPAAWGGHAAGTFVFADDADCLAYCDTASDWGAASIGWYDGDSTGDYTPGDVAFLIPRAPGAPAGTLVPAFSVRLTASAPPGQDPSSSQAPSTSGASSTQSPTSAPESPTTSTPVPPSTGEDEAAAPGGPAAGVVLALLAVARWARRRLG